MACFPLLRDSIPHADSERWTNGRPEFGSGDLDTAFLSAPHCNTRLAQPPGSIRKAPVCSTQYTPRGNTSATPGTARLRTRAGSLTVRVRAAHSTLPRRLADRWRRLPCSPAPFGSPSNIQVQPTSVPLSRTKPAGAHTTAAATVDGAAVALAPRRLPRPGRARLRRS